MLCSYSPAFHLVRWHEAARLKTITAGLPRLYRRLGTCYAALNLYSQWEATQRQRGLTPARDVEKALRYDEPTLVFNNGDNFSGQGRRTVRGYLFRTEPSLLSQSKSESPKDLKNANN